MVSLRLSGFDIVNSRLGSSGCPNFLRVLAPGAVASARSRTDHFNLPSGPSTCLASISSFSNPSRPVRHLGWVTPKRVRNGFQVPSRVGTHSLNMIPMGC